MSTFKFPTYNDFIKSKFTKNQKSNLKFASENSLITGEVLEFGVYKGKTINVLADCFPNQLIYGFDSFEGLPENWIDINGKELLKGTFKTDLPPVKSNVILVKGWFDKTIPLFLKDNKVEKIKLLHIDCDLYSSTKTILTLLNEFIYKGTVIVFDELANWKKESLYPTYKDEEYKALKEWVIENNREFIILGRSTSSQATILIKK
jgi:hypothetical protein